MNTPLYRTAVLTLALSLSGLVLGVGKGGAAVMNDYCIQPPFVTQSVPPLVMFEVGRDHKLYYEAYDDASDLDDDGRIDKTYKHSIDYYGYFDPHKCYQFTGGASGGTTGSSQFNPVSVTTDKFCSSSGGQWSGNVLNWLTMSRMDTLRKVLYGGHRSADSSTQTVLERVFLPQDAHSWGKELTGRLCRNTGTVDTDHPAYTYSCSINADCTTGYSCTDVSNQLIGIGASDTPSACDQSVTVTNTNNKILYATYSHDSGLSDTIEYGSTHSDLMTSFDPANLTAYSLVDDFNAAVFDPRTNHSDHSNIMAVADFQVTNSGANKKGTWQFAVDGDDGVEVAIFQVGTNTSGTVVASYYGGHSSCFTSSQDPNSTAFCSTSQSGSISLTNGWYRMVARETENSGSDGIKVWVKRTNDSTWQLFGTSTFGSGYMRAPNITSSNVCSIKAVPFVETGVPSTGLITAKRHLFCNTSLSNGPPLLRLLTNKTNRIWEWASKERPVCDDTLGTPIDFAVRVKVCDATVGSSANLKDNENCKEYPSEGSGNWKPVGLLQKYGESDGSKICSKTMAKSCTTDSDCTMATEGKCVDKALMYFGMITTSYMKNESGGVVRKNIGSILDETNFNNGQFQTSENEQGNIIHTLDRLQLVGYRYSDWSYQDASGGSCGWITTRPLNEGECRNWGNPIGEMMYESLRYFAGKLTPTADFAYSDSNDSGLQLSKPDWGYKDDSVYKSLYDVYPSCARPFILLLSDVNTSYDSDQIPGSSFKKPDGSTFAEDAASPHLGLGDTVGSNTLLNNLTATIGTTEGITGNNWFIGENGSIQDFICTAKSADKFSLLRGMCPSEPTKKGSYYAAALAYYGKTMFKSKTGKPEVNTFAVALASPFADLKIKAGSRYVTLVPVGKSVSGGLSVYDACANRMSLSYNADGHGLTISPKSPADANAYCPTNQIVNFYVDDIKYDSENSVVYAKFRINFEDVEQGADHDMDAIVSYEICTQTANANGYGTCNTTLTANQIEVKLFDEYAAGSIDQVLGFVINGSTEDGVYLVVKDKDVSGADGDTPAVVANMPTQWSRVFTVSSTGSTSQFLKNPLWYAAKWGGFTDKNGSNTPDQQREWDVEPVDGDPDNYFLVTNPLKLEQQLNKALSAILAKVSSGTAASILSNAEGTGAVLLQAIFYPKKMYDANTEVSWIGELHNFWYYVDPLINNSSIREDTDYADATGAAPHFLNLRTDDVASFYFDPSVNQTMVKLYQDVDGNGTPDGNPVAIVSPDDVKSIWKAGKLLWERDITTLSGARTIYTTPTDGTNNLKLFDSSAKADLQSYLQAADATSAEKIIQYVSGYDFPSDATMRSRRVTIGSASGVWKLGDIVSSTPRIMSGVALNNYDMSPPSGYRDATYVAFISTSEYKNRGIAFAGANDGMLHAFNLGLLDVTATGYQKAKLSGTDLGKELWAYIPRNVLPYLKYLSDPNYGHLYYVDATSTIADVSIGTTAVSGAYWDGAKTKDSWRTVLVGGMGLGGATRETTNTTCTNCVKTPVDVGGNPLGYSSYFALDVTTPESPTFLWEFSDPDLGYATTGPAIIRVSESNGPCTAANALRCDGQNKNGRWFAVFASGPTGPIDTATHQFLGKSDKTLKLFIVDLKTGTLVRKIDTSIANAFAGSLQGGALDADRWNLASGGNYKDDVVYVGYVKKSSTENFWTDGGVLRLMIKENTLDPNNLQATDFVVSTVIDGIGPVTSSIGRLQDRKKENLWLYFGTGRYYYKSAAEAPFDDCNGTRKIFGIKEPCYTAANDIDNSCSTSLVISNLADKSTSPTDSLDTDKAGWYINLDATGSGSCAERIITNPVALSTGVVFFTSFKPTADICSFGGNTYLWATKFDTGASPLGGALYGKAIVQMSTGSFEELTFNDPKVPNSSAFTARDNRRTGTAMQGKPPSDPPTIINRSQNKPVKRIIHLQEK